MTQFEYVEALKLVADSYRRGHAQGVEEGIEIARSVALGIIMMGFAIRDTLTKGDPKW